MDQPDRMAGVEQLLTPTKITAWLDCDHSLTLQRQLDSGALTLERTPFGSFAQMLFDKGQQHEAECLDHYRSLGMAVLEVQRGAPGQPFQAWIDDLGDVFATEADVLYQLPLAHDGIRGIADFVVRVIDDATGKVTWEPVDAKLARAEARAGHVLQLCCYAEAIEAATGTLPQQVHLWLGSGATESIRTADVMPYWRRIRRQLRDLLAQGPDADNTIPVPCSHCEFCDFAEVCLARWRDEDSLVFVAGLRTDERTALLERGLDTLAGLAQMETGGAVPSVRRERLGRVKAQAELQLEARNNDAEPPPFRLIPGGDDPTWGHGLELLPEPDDGDVFLDFEGHPFWRADTDIFFLFGWIAADGSDGSEYHSIWAHDQEGEATATRELVEYLAKRRDQHPGMHVYHYNHTERSSLVRLTERYGIATSTLTELIETGAFVDLMTVVRNSLQAGVESYGLKEVERLTGFERSHDVSSGAGAVVEYDKWMGSQSAESLDRIATYNEDDVRATQALRDWLVAQRSSDLPWRAARLELDEPLESHDEQVEALHAFGPDTPEALLGDLLEYWAREGMTHKAQALAHLTADDDRRLDDPSVISGLTSVGMVERTHRTKGTPLDPGMEFEFPSQELGAIAKARKLLYLAGDGQTGYANIFTLDVAAGRLVTSWGARCDELKTLPDCVVLNDWVRPAPKPDALVALADVVLDRATLPGGARGGLALLRRDVPTFRSSAGPLDGRFDEDLDRMREWVRHLDGTTVAIQGPPGTGKTFRGAHLVHSLITGGQRVGITAFSHAAIDNLLRAVVALFDECDTDQLRAVRKRAKPKDGGVPGVRYIDDNGKVASGDFNLLAGTTWLFANEKMREEPVDVLIVDEAGQLSLADTLAASTSARNVVLLGDPLQLPQVSLASHPNGSGASALEHVLGEDPTIPPERGVFLSETRRMHPDVCRFISNVIYDSRLTSHPDCARQSTEAGTGLRWIRAEHQGSSTESAAEAEIVVATIKNLIGTEWTNHIGETGPLTVNDVMVVAPYNDQVALLRQRLDGDPVTHGVPVGTVDKFQGQEAAVVLFSMTSSTAADAPRGSDFLFSRNRLNVAISRARCLAYLVCTEPLLNSRARDVEEMKLLSCLASFIEYAEGESLAPRTPACLRRLNTPDPVRNADARGECGGERGEPILGGYESAGTADQDSDR